MKKLRCQETQAMHIIIIVIKKQVGAGKHPVWLVMCRWCVCVPVCLFSPRCSGEINVLLGAPDTYSAVLAQAWLTRWFWEVRGQWAWLFLTLNVPGPCTPEPIVKTPREGEVRSQVYMAYSRGADWGFMSTLPGLSLSFPHCFWPVVPVSGS